MKKLIHRKFEYSGCYRINLLHKSSNFYVMDNHGAALWCWMQHFNPEQTYRLIHIDKHYDTLDSNIEPWLESLPENISDLTVEEYYAIEHSLGRERYQTIRWDNYIPIFDRLYGENVASYLFFTHRKGTSGTMALDQEKVEEWQPHTIFENLDFLITQTEDKTILNLDLDYFFLAHDDKYFQLFSDDAIDIIFNQIRDCYVNSDKVEVLTVALSPECCGGWANSLRVYNRLAEKLNLERLAIN